MQDRSIEWVHFQAEKEAWSVKGLPHMHGDLKSQHSCKNLGMAAIPVLSAQGGRGKKMLGLSGQTDKPNQKDQGLKSNVESDWGGHLMSNSSSTCACVCKCVSTHTQGSIPSPTCIHTHEHIHTQTQKINSLLTEILTRDNIIQIQIIARFWNNNFLVGLYKIYMWI